VGIARHAVGDPTIVISTYVNPPCEVACYNSSAGLVNGTVNPVPMWTLLPSTFNTSTLFFVDSARHQAAGDADNAVDTFSLLSEDNYPSVCTLQGLSSTGASADGGAGSALRWSWSAPECAAFSAQDQWRYVDAADDGSIVCAQLFVEEAPGLRAPVTHAWDAQSGEHLWARPLDANAGGYGVQISSDGRWVLQGIDDSTTKVNRSAYVLSTKDGSTRDKVALYWNIPPAISGEGAFVVGGTTSGLLVYLWDSANSSYVLQASPPLPPLNQAGWLPLDLTISTYTEPNGTVRHVCGVTWMGYDYEAIGRITLWDLDAIAAGVTNASGAILLDAFLDRDFRQIDWSYIRADGPYFVVGSAGGDTYYSAPTHWLFRVGEPAPLWSYSSKGGATGIDVVLTAPDTLWVAASGSQSPGGDGNGGDAYLWRFVVTG